MIKSEHWKISMILILSKWKKYTLRLTISSTSLIPNPHSINSKNSMQIMHKLTGNSKSNSNNLRINSLSLPLKKKWSHRLNKIKLLNSKIKSNLFIKNFKKSEPRRKKRILRENHGYYWVIKILHNFTVKEILWKNFKKTL